VSHLTFEDVFNRMVRLKKHTNKTLPAVNTQYRRYMTFHQCHDIFKLQTRSRLSRQLSDKYIKQCNECHNRYNVNILQFVIVS